MADQPAFATRIQSWGLGWLLALLVLIICVVLYFIGTPLTPTQVLALIGALALARLL